MGNNRRGECHIIGCYRKAARKVGNYAYCEGCAGVQENRWPPLPGAWGPTQQQAALERIAALELRAEAAEKALGEARELLRHATRFVFNPMSLLEQSVFKEDMMMSWKCEDRRGVGRLYPTRDEAIAAARKLAKGAL